MNPWAQILTLAAVTLVTFLAGLFLMLIHNLNEQLLYTRGEVLFQVYWQPEAPIETVENQWTSFQEFLYLSDLKTYSPEDGLEILSRELGESVDLEWLEADNPLPSTALLAFNPQEPDNELWTRTMLHRLQNLEHVDAVHVSPLRSDMTAAWSRISNRVLWPLVAFLGLVLALVVGNTLKLAQLSRHEEVEILRLVGAKQWYITLPLIVGGALQGVLGGLLALAMLKGVQLVLFDLLNFPPLMLTVRFLPAAQAALLAGVPALVGAVSGRVAVND